MAVSALFALPLLVQFDTPAVEVTASDVVEHYVLQAHARYSDSLAAAQDADLILNSTLSFAGYHVAEKLDLPTIAAFVQPATPTREFPGTTAALPPAWLPFKGLYNYLSFSFESVDNHRYLQTFLFNPNFNFLVRIIFS